MQSALNFVARVRTRLSRPRYADFLQLLRVYYERGGDAPWILGSVRTTLRTHADLLEEFEAFLASQSRRHDANSEETDASPQISNRNTQHSPRYPSTPDSIRRWHNTNKENENIYNLTCSICLEGISTHACVPCGHRCMCRDCAEWPSGPDEDEEDDVCPTCNAAIEDMVEIYDI
ncbi:hypothetical protein BSKO_09301 [Bryopsis sp. KO-2023]|nr:hypothetical protein BSKO_09301 [Bryopsis sp. KO-2023]